MISPIFWERMQALLSTDLPAFRQAIESGSAVHGLRVNTVKCSRGHFLSLRPPIGEAIPYTPDGFYHNEEKIGRHPFHHAGMVYSQDPGAMSALQALPIQAGWRVLDACAAPGGKSAQLAAAIGPSGVLVSNEYVPSRCKLLVGNIERLGISNALVLNRDSAALRSDYPRYFDLAVVDAPCSGEGMFRKSEEARTMWSEETVKRCAERQKVILADIAETVRPSGYLLYATCTYAPEENEEQIATFLDEHEDFVLCHASDALMPYTAPGIPVRDRDLSGARRFYPHLSPGEGQFVAVLRRTGEEETRPAPAYREAGERPGRADLAVLSAFFANAWGEAAMAEAVWMIHGQPVLPPSIPLPPTGVFAAGVLVGEIRKGNLFPHHQLFSAMGRRFLRKIDLAMEDPRLRAYLHGDTIPTPGMENGYAAVLVEGCPLGGAKVVDGMAKNLYPKGLRQG